MVYANQSRVYRLWLVSPWISTLEEKLDPLYVLIEALRKQRCDVVVITRPPKEGWHFRAEALLEKEVKATIYYCPTLHTKLYIAECDGFRGVVLGSPNLTSRADTTNRELAVEFRTTKMSGDDETAAFIDELIQYAYSLRDQRDVVLKFKKQGGSNADFSA
jgi:phosphatidylserine/phosphatidylglycerophosphate/cardiolipin synthase-like enzyme